MEIQKYENMDFHIFENILWLWPGDCFTRPFMALINPKAAPGAKQRVGVYQMWSAIEALAACRELGSLGAVRVWSLLWLFRDPGSGEVDLTRDDIAGTVGLSPRRVSRILSALRQRHLITTRRQHLPRIRGPGRVIITIKAPEAGAA